MYKDKQRTLAHNQVNLRCNPTAAELAVKSALEILGIKFVFQKGFLRRETVRIVDFYLPSPNLICIEVDGKYHENQQSYDRYREKEIQAQRKGKIRFIRLTNEWVFQQNNLCQSLRDVLGIAV